MKKTLLKRCQEPMEKEQKEKNMLVLGDEMFEKKTPKTDIPMYKVQRDKEEEQ